MTPVVTSVQTKGDKAALINMSEGKPVWCPSFEIAAKLETGKPIPSDWTQKDGDYGPQAFPPKDKKSFGGGFGGGAAAFRNTKDGQAAEQERMDRRTALMQAVTLYGHDTTVSHSSVLQAADDLYAWLRQTSGGSTGATLEVASIKPQPGPSTANAAPPNNSPRGETRQEPSVEGEATGGSCLHPSSSPTKPDRSSLPKGFVRCLTCGMVFKP